MKSEKLKPFFLSKKGKTVLGIVAAFLILYNLPGILSYYFLTNDWDMPEVILPGETADSESLREMLQWNQIPVFRNHRYSYKTSTMRDAHPETGSGQMHDFLKDNFILYQDENFDANNFICRGENSRISLGKITPPVFDTEKCPEPYVRGAVLSRFEGSGKLTRFWMTQASASGGKIDDEILRIYIDDNTEPFLQVPLHSLYDGSAGEIFMPPFGAGSNSYIAWYYPVVFSSKIILTLDQIGPIDNYFHQTNVTLDEKPKQRMAAGEKLPLRNKVKESLMNFRLFASGPALLQHRFQKNEKNRTFRLQGPATIHSLSISFPEDSLSSLQSSSIKIHWDREKTPSVNLPLLDLFMAGRTVPQSKNSLYHSIQDKTITLSLLLPMPFRNDANISILGLPGRDDISFELKGERTVPSTGFGRLKTQMHITEAPAEDFYHPLLHAKGRGRLAGICAELIGYEDENIHPFMFLEGDEILHIDSRKPMQGTGTEDYFNSSYYYPSRDIFTPFAQNWAKVQTAGSSVSQCRWHILSDAIDFQKEINFDLEIGPHNPKTLKMYKTVAYFYN